MHHGIHFWVTNNIFCSTLLLATRRLWEKIFIFFCYVLLHCFRNLSFTIFNPSKQDDESRKCFFFFLYFSAWDWRLVSSMMIFILRKKNYFDFIHSYRHRNFLFERKPKINKTKPSITFRTVWKFSQMKLCYSSPNPSTHNETYLWFVQWHIFVLEEFWLFSVLFTKFKALDSKVLRNNFFFYFVVESVGSI